MYCWNVSVCSVAASVQRLHIKRAGLGSCFHSAQIVTLVRHVPITDAKLAKVEWGLSQARFASGHVQLFVGTLPCVVENETH